MQVIYATKRRFLWIVLLLLLLKELSLLQRNETKIPTVPPKSVTENAGIP